MKKNSGLTLIELIISILVLGILTGILYNFFLTGIELIELTYQNTQSSTNLSGILNRIKDDYSYSENIYYTDTTSLYFFTFQNSDTTLTEIRYKFQKPNLYIYNSKYNDTGIIKNIDNINFTFSAINSNDTLLIVNLHKNNINMTGEFFSLNE